MAKIVAGVALIALGIGLMFVPGLQGLGGLLAVKGAAMTAIVTAVIGIGGSLLMSGIAPQGSLQHGSSAQVAIRQSTAPWQIVYGRARIGGVFVYLSVDTDKKYLNMVVVHAAHPCQAINAYWLDGRQIIFLGGGNSGTADQADHLDPSGNTYNFKGQVYVENRLGFETGSAFATLSTHDSNWPSSATLRGHCCSYIRCQYDQNMWPNGYPSIRVDICGRTDIYDPRTGGYGYSENPALCLANVLVNKDYGLRCDYATEIDNTQLIASANLCDEAVALAYGSTEPRYSCNGTFDTSMAAGNIAQSMLSAMSGRMTCVGGLWKIFAGGWITPTVAFTDDDFIGPIKFSPKRKYRDLINGVRGRFTCPSYPYNQYGPGFPNNQKIAGVFDGQWQACDIPYYAQDALHGYGSDALLAEDNDTRLWADITLPYTISVSEAQRHAKINLLRNRQQGTGTIMVGLRGLQCSALDVIQISHSRWGWTNKFFEVTNWRLKLQDAQDDQGPMAYVEMDIQEADSSVYSWTTSEELSVEDNPSPIMPGRGIISQATFSPVSSANLNSAILGGINPLTATDVGTSCDINVAAFTLQLGWGTVNYNAGVCHGAGYALRYYVYCKDPKFSGGTLTYYATTNFADCVAAQENVYVGSLVTPSSGGSSTSGAGVGGGGGSSGVATGVIFLSNVSGVTSVNWTSSAGGDSIEIRGYYGNLHTPQVDTWQGMYNVVNAPGGSSTYGYVVVAVFNTYSLGSDVGTTHQGAATLQRTSYNAITWNNISANYYDIYRVQGGATGKIGSNITPPLFLNDTGLSASAGSPPAHFFAVGSGPSGSVDVSALISTGYGYGIPTTFQLWDVTTQTVLATTGT